MKLLRVPVHRAHTWAPVHDTKPRVRFPGSMEYFWKMGSLRSVPTLASGMFGKMTSCSTVNRMVPSPYLHKQKLHSFIQFQFQFYLFHDARNTSRDFSPLPSPSSSKCLPTAFPVWIYGDSQT